MFANIIAFVGFLLFIVFPVVVHFGLEGYFAKASNALASVAKRIEARSRRRQWLRSRR